MGTVRNCQVRRPRSSCAVQPSRRVARVMSRAIRPGPRVLVRHDRLAWLGACHGHLRYHGLATLDAY